ncbi:MAG: GNAT family N-acetyltransferase [Acidimicrobiia bacterium]|nr:GNAT family N-acetyltransferase [Acidimicrobiia bacterium]MYC57983.1 GNAT family N-acetyltransferase [Acidimicrobiia bacterium]MYG94671.1 GNAT family N-acetyltransferase [Acidimicrobiia bacterium]MYI31068.1 GNAT family N-acetyltransferase [Acidimicrobiia bacterium]
MQLTISEATEVTEELLQAFQRLIPQLSSSNSPPDTVAMQDIVASPSTRLLLARSEDVIVGSLTLVLVRIPTGVRAIIEDVVVDIEIRGQGVGKALSEAAIELARAAGAITVDLTSRSSRVAANRLYRCLGFKIRDTNVYRYRF